MGNCSPFFYCSWLIVDDAIVVVDRKLPSVIRVCFLDVYAEEVHLMFVLYVYLVEAPGLASKWRSGVGAEDECRRFVSMVRQPPQFTGPDTFFIDEYQVEIRSPVSDSWSDSIAFQTVVQDFLELGTAQLQLCGNGFHNGIGDLVQELFTTGKIFHECNEVRTG